MVEASWGDKTKSPGIPWRMSASLDNVPRGDSDMAKVTNLESAVRVWLGLDPTHRVAAVLKLDHAIQIDGVASSSFVGEGITVLSERLPTQTE